MGKRERRNAGKQTEEKKKGCGSENKGTHHVEKKKSTEEMIP